MRISSCEDLQKELIAQYIQKSEWNFHLFSEYQPSFYSCIVLTIEKHLRQPNSEFSASLKFRDIIIHNIRVTFWKPLSSIFMNYAQEY